MIKEFLKSKARMEEDSKMYIEIARNVANKHIKYAADCMAEKVLILVENASEEELREFMGSKEIDFEDKLLVLKAYEATHKDFDKVVKIVFPDDEDVDVEKIVGHIIKMRF